MAQVCLQWEGQCLRLGPPLGGECHWLLLLHALCPTVLASFPLTIPHRAAGCRVQLLEPVGGG